MSDHDKRTTPDFPKNIPVFKIKITNDALNRAIRKNSHACVIADAIKEKFPDATRISVNRYETKFTRGDIRYSYLTPGTGVRVLTDFDYGTRPPNPEIRFYRGKMTTAYQAATQRGMAWGEQRYTGTESRPTDTIIGGKPTPPLDPHLMDGPTLEPKRARDRERRNSASKSKRSRVQRIFGMRTFAKDDVIPDRGPGVFATEEEILAAEAREAAIVAATRRRAVMGTFDLFDENGDTVDDNQTKTTDERADETTS